MPQYHKQLQQKILKAKNVSMLIKDMIHILNRLPHDGLKRVVPHRIHMSNIVEVLMIILIRSPIKFKMAIKF